MRSGSGSGRAALGAAGGGYGHGGGEWPQLLEPVAHFGVFRWTEGGREVRSGAWSGRERERERGVSQKTKAKERRGVARRRAGLNGTIPGAQ